VQHPGLLHRCKYCHRYPYPLNYHERGDCDSQVYAPGFYWVLHLVEHEKVWTIAKLDEDGRWQPFGASYTLPGSVYFLAVGPQIVSPTESCA